MDIITTPSYEEMQSIYNRYFSLSFMGPDINNKFALISLVCFLTHKLKEKNPNVTYWSVLYKINNTGNNRVDDNLLKGLAVICSDFGYGCNDFPTFGIEEKKIPSKIKELLENILPF